MIDRQAADALAEYRAGLEAEIALLRQLDEVAGRQRGVTATRDFDRLRVESDERERLTRALVALEQEMREVRARIQRMRLAVAALPAYGEVLGLRQTATDLVTKILATDEESMQALADAELARRAAVASLERGESTLAAYRRVLTPPVSHAALVDRRG